MFFVRALAFGSAPERFFVLPLVALVALSAFLAEGVRSARLDDLLFALGVGLADFRSGAAFTALDDRATLSVPPDPTARSAASS